MNAPESSGSSEPRSSKDFWDKFDILFKPLGTLVTGAVLLGLGHYATQVVEDKQAEETNRRLYAEIMSSRERADTDLRREMFSTIIDKFFKPSNENIDEKIVAIELLAYNFHDVIDLSPLFKHVNSLVVGESKQAEDQRERLERVAREVIEKQLTVLANDEWIDQGRSEEGICGTDIDVRFDVLDSLYELDNEREIRCEWAVRRITNRPAGADNPKDRFVAMEVMDYHREDRELSVRLEYGAISQRSQPEIDVQFRVGFFDFPMIDNTRVSNSQRIAVALKRWTNQGADLSIVYFPGSRASLKEKPYYQEIIEQLRVSNERLSGG